MLPEPYWVANHCLCEHVSFRIEQCGEVSSSSFGFWVPRILLWAFKIYTSMYLQASSMSFWFFFVEYIPPMSLYPQRNSECMGVTWRIKKHQSTVDTQGAIDVQVANFLLLKLWAELHLGLNRYEGVFIAYQRTQHDSNNWNLPV